MFVLGRNAISINTCFPYIPISKKASASSLHQRTPWTLDCPIVADGNALDDCITYIYMRMWCDIYVWLRHVLIKSAYFDVVLLLLLVWQSSGHWVRRLLLYLNGYALLWFNEGSSNEVVGVMMMMCVNVHFIYVRLFIYAFWARV